MALPATRRPVLVEEEFESELKSIKKLKLSKVTLFMIEMGKWYKSLGRSVKSKLTAKKLKRRAISCLKWLNYDYDKLPTNWVITLIEAHNIKLYRKKEKLALPEDSLDNAEVSIFEVF